MFQKFTRRKDWNRYLQKMIMPEQVLCILPVRLDIKCEDSSALRFDSRPTGSGGGDTFRAHDLLPAGAAVIMDRDVEDKEPEGPQGSGRRGEIQGRHA